MLNVDNINRQVSYVVLASIQTTLVVLWSLPGREKARSTLPAAILGVAAALALGVLSNLEHARSIKPPALIEIYLFFTILLDAVRARTIWKLSSDKTVFIVFIISMFVKFALFVQESWPRQSYPSSDSYTPEEKAGWLNRRLFWWINPLLLLGTRKSLEMKDLPELSHDLRSQECWKSFSESWKEASPIFKTKCNGLLLFSCWAFKSMLLKAVVPRLCFTGFTFAQPFLIDAVTKYLQNSASEANLSQGHLLILAYIIVYIGIAISEACYQYMTYRTIILMRGCLVPLIYEKTLSIKMKAGQESAPLTLMSADIEKIAFGMRYMHEAWGNVIEIALALWLLYDQLKYGGLSPILIATLCGIVAATMAPAIGHRQAKWVNSIQKRLGVTSYMINSMKSLKLEGLTSWFMNSIQNLRIDEIKYGNQFRSFLIYAVSLSFGTTVISPVVGFGIFVATSNGPLTTHKAFTTLALFSVLQTPMSMLLQAVPNLISALGSLERIRLFLLTEDPPQEITYKTLHKSDQTLDTLIELKFTQAEHPNTIVAENWSTGWDHDVPIIKNITFRIDSSSLAVICGPTGCGKSTFLAGLQRETPYENGHLRCQTLGAAYCAQEPWLQNGTITDNVIGPSAYEARWYREVVEASGLSKDINLLPLGSHTMVGSKGLSLSGGQKHRVALARALYSRKALLLLDDIFSGFDTGTERLVMTNLFAEDGFCKKHKVTVILVTHSANAISFADQVISLDKKGHLIENDGSLLSVSMKMSTTDLHEDAVDKGNMRHGIARNSNLQVELAAQVETAEASQKIGDYEIYQYYLGIVGWLNTIVFFVAVAVFTFGLTFPSVWVQWWAAADEKDPNHHLALYLGVYSFLAVLAEVALFLGLLTQCTHLMSNMIPRASQKLHFILLETVLRAPMSFFNSTDSGVTINRFSQDLQLVDMELPLAIVETTAAFALCIAQLIIIFVTGKYIAAIIPLCLAVFYLLQKFYLKTSKQLRFMELEAKSPLYSKFMETVSGLTTIRAFGWQKHFLEQNCSLTDASQNPYYLLFVIQRWLTLVLDFTVGGIAVLIVGVAVGAHGSIGAGSAALGLLNIINLSESFKQLISNWTVLETSIGAVSRVKQFKVDVQPEQELEDPLIVSESWPENGHIEFHNVSASYSQDGKPVLSNMNLSISAGEKVAICGPSGRSLEASEGTVAIDGLDISTVSHDQIRSSICCIPQEVTILPGTIRQNIDPRGISHDNDIVEVLKEVRLWDRISTGLGGLDGYIHGDTFSQGQRQLLRLASAVLRIRKVVVLDEATSR
ncbi:multidrug resistance protein, putative [Talaromyces stipitatus ATCC 10500]|uniref:Multidrug resistance protein, putative n=1 Tax=Talaromyces stipitatus (strain ATCC 10500 / CBS 375.48 / QM 6759 / NRRL 1006) TaxID=441959 RepID=B8LZU1_TALSN|nr:multidrug resistance protein, putative [Talaromyces stipitatus ATCC 10500]EED20873.1 multidrug resistance protein, putative [Talaromyces stipitatus ATCC 10500]